MEEREMSHASAVLLCRALRAKVQQAIDEAECSGLDAHEIAMQLLQNAYAVLEASHSAGIARINWFVDRAIFVVEHVEKLLGNTSRE